MFTTKYPEPPQKGKFFSWLWFFIRPHKYLFFTLTFLRLFRSTLLHLQPFYVGNIIDAAQTTGVSSPQTIFWLCFLLFSALFSYTLLFFGIGDSNLSDKLSRELTMYSTKHILDLPQRWHEEQGTGKKLQRIMTARQSLSYIVNEIYFWQLGWLGGSIVGIIISITFDLPPIYFLFFAGFIGTFLCLSWVTGKKFIKLHDKHNAFHESVIEKVYDFTASMHTVRHFLLDKFIMGRAKEGEGIAYKAMKKVNIHYYWRWFYLNCTGMFWIMLGIIGGLYFLDQKIMTIGAFAMVVWLYFRVWSALEWLAEMQARYYEARAGFTRLTNTLMLPKEKVDFNPPSSVPSSWNKIQFNKLSFTYNKKHEHALKNITVEINKGEKIAFVGKSGAGKSTIIKLLTKQELPTGGNITIANKNTKENTDTKFIKRDDLLKNIAIVPQEVDLFNISIEENIIFDKRKNKQQLVQCLKKAQAYDFVQQLPKKEKTVIGERGIKLSGGQKQRVAIARALARKAEIIIFDEATSSLDSETEKIIQEALKHAFKKQTVIIIAHRLATIKEVDKIIVLDKGKIIEQGSFKELIKKKGSFAKMWKMQKL